MKKWLARVAIALAGIVVIASIGLAATWQRDRTVAELTPRWAPPPSRFVDVLGMKVHVRDEGPADDPTPIVMLHGTSSSLHTWQGWAEGLRGGRRVVRFDLPGFGLTGPSPTNDYSLDGYVRFTLAMLDHLGVRRCVLAGNSLGGTIALATALAAPERIERLVLVDSGGHPAAPASVPIGFRIAQTPVLKNLVLFSLPRSVIESSVRNVYGDPSRVTPELVDRYFDLTLRAGNRAAVIERLRQIPPNQIAPRIPTLKVPTLILWGERDRLIPIESGRLFAQEIAGSRLVVYADLGHVPQEEDPARTVEALRTFIGTRL
jgi:pimeloyl-ACP methyl ester carboxylesterase